MVGHVLDSGMQKLWYAKFNNFNGKNPIMDGTVIQTSKFASK
jgi:hypothetical protein